MPPRLHFQEELGRWRRRDLTGNLRSQELLVGLQRQSPRERAPAPTRSRLIHTTTLREATCPPRPVQEDTEAGKEEDAPECHGQRASLGTMLRLATSGERFSSGGGGGYYCVLTTFLLACVCSHQHAPVLRPLALASISTDMAAPDSAAVLCQQRA